MFVVCIAVALDFNMLPYRLEPKWAAGSIEDYRVRRPLFGSHVLGSRHVIQMFVVCIVNALDFNMNRLTF